jgi:hypothetical protein
MLYGKKRRQSKHFKNLQSKRRSGCQIIFFTLLVLAVGKYSLEGSSTAATPDEEALTLMAQMLREADQHFSDSTLVSQDNR